MCLPIRSMKSPAFFFLYVPVGAGDTSSGLLLSSLNMLFHHFPHGNFRHPDVEPLHLHQSLVPLLASSHYVRFQQKSSRIRPSLLHDFFLRTSPSHQDSPISFSEHTSTALNFTSDPENVDSPSNNSLYENVQTGPVELDSSFDGFDEEESGNDKNEKASGSQITVSSVDNVREPGSGNGISVNSQIEPVSHKELTVTMAGNDRVLGIDNEVSGQDKNGADSENESTDTVAVNACVSSIDGTDNGVFKNDSDSVTTGKMADNVGNLASEKQLKCDLYTSHPIYQPGSCPYVDEAYDCQINGTTDTEHTKWWWQPDVCDPPRFNATDFMVRPRGKNLMMEGDSMNRTNLNLFCACSVKVFIIRARRMRPMGTK